MTAVDFSAPWYARPRPYRDEVIHRNCTMASQLHPDWADKIRAGTEAPERLFCFNCRAYDAIGRFFWMQTMQPVRRARDVEAA